MPIRQQLFSPVNAFIQGEQDARQARQSAQQEQYGQSRNALAQMEVQNAPQEQARRNKLLDLQAQGAEQNLSAEKAKFAYATLKQAMDSGNPKGFVLQHVPDLVSNMQRQGTDLQSMSDQEAAQYFTDLAGAMAGKAGIAPPVKVKTIGDTADPGAGILQEDPTTGVLKQVVAPQKPDNFATGQANADRRAQEQREFTAEQNRLNRESQESRARTTASKPPKVTEGERVSANYLLRMEEAAPLISGFRPTTKDAVAFSRVLNSDSEVMSSVANRFLSPAAQKYYQASSDWVRAKLRKESGAVIAPAEMIQEIKTYFPMPNDSDEVVEQKRQARLTAEQGMRSMAGGAPQANAQHPKQPPATNANGWALMTDANGNRAYVSPDGAQFEEVR